MKLQILVPQYKETDEIVKPLLDSLAIQQNIDFNEIGVIFVNDGSDVLLSSKLLDSYPFKIDYYKNEHKGVSATRNYALNKAIADYIMFCDADDMFYNACGLYILFREIAAGDFNGLISVFVEETRDLKTRMPAYINRENDRTFVHGKMWNRQYLIDNEIEWNEDLTIHEDSYFNTLATELSDKKLIKYCPTSFYLWKWRDDSVCRHDEKYILKTYNHMLNSSTALVHELLTRKKKAIAQKIVGGMIYDAYFTMNKKQWIAQENQEYRDKTEKRFAKYYQEFKEMFLNLSEDMNTMLVYGIKNRMFREGLVLESITFDDWIKHIETLN